LDKDVLIVDYKAGNVMSVKNMFEKLGFSVLVSSEPADVLKAKKIVLPGVGKFDFGMKSLFSLGLVNALSEQVLVNKVPILGICLGAQLFTKGSEEGMQQGLGWFDIETIRFKPFNGLKTPHMGWNETHIVLKDSPLFAQEQYLVDPPRFYFVHNYHFDNVSSKEILTETFYGYNFVSAFQRDNIFGVQFHPEKSHKFGMALFTNFMNVK